MPVGLTDNVPANACAGANQCDGNGNCRKATGQGCGGANECVSGFCVDNICCEDACSGTCMACDVSGMLGMCVNVPTGQDDGACSGTQSCDGTGACKVDDGGACTPATAAQCSSGICADDVCCNNACTATCMACNVSGDEGTCINVPPGLDDDNATMTCTGASQSCDGMGACKKDKGAVCVMDSECTSGNCVDGVCCESACTTTCFQCNKAGSVGDCVEVAQLVEDNFPAGACNNTMRCDGTSNGNSACKLANGQDCNNNSDCASNKCPGGMDCAP